MIKKIKNKKGFLDISFSLIFAFLVGGMILFGAVYGVNKYSKTSELVRSAESGKSLGNIMTSFESSGIDSKFGSIEFPKKTKIISECSNDGKLGIHNFRISEELRNKMSKNDVKISFKNKYVFSKKEVIGENFNLFAKSFNYPYEVATAIYLLSTDDEYCFVDAPRKIEKELRTLEMNNIIFENCNKNAIKICFKNQDSCDIKVDYSFGKVEKDAKEYFFDTDALMYGAIFSEGNNYECTTKRLILRAKTLAKIYEDKSVILRNRCDSEILSDLGAYFSSLDNFKSSKDIFTISNLESSLDSRNKGSYCKLW